MYHSCCICRSIFTSISILPHFSEASFRAYRYLPNKLVTLSPQRIRQRISSVVAAFKYSNPQKDASPDNEGSPYFARESIIVKAAYLDRHYANKQLPRLLATAHDKTDRSAFQVKMLLPIQRPAFFLTSFFFRFPASRSRARMSSIIEAQPEPLTICHSSEPVSTAISGGQLAFQQHLRDNRAVTTFTGVQSVPQHFRQAREAPLFIEITKYLRENIQQR